MLKQQDIIIILCKNNKKKIVWKQNPTIVQELKTSHK